MVQQRITKKASPHFERVSAVDSNRQAARRTTSQFACRFSRYSFIDLAQIICKVPELKVENSDESSSDDDYDGYISEPSNLVSVLFSG